MLPASAKAKGAFLQRTVRDMILDRFKNLEMDDVRSTGMGQPGEDIQLSPAARKDIPYQMECKNKATSQLHTYYKQAKEHGKFEPLVIVKKDRDRILVALEAGHFFDLLLELKTLKEKNAD